MLDLVAACNGVDALNPPRDPYSPSLVRFHTYGRLLETLGQKRVDDLGRQLDRGDTARRARWEDQMNAVRQTLCPGAF